MAAQSPRELHAMFRDAANAGDVDAVAALYEADPTFAPDATQVASGTDAMRAHLAGLLAMQPRFERVDTTKVFEAGDLALICSDWEAVAVGPEGEPVRLAGRGTEVARRQADATWLLVIDNPWGTA